MNHKFLNQIFKAFDMMNRCYAVDYDAPPEGGGGDPAPKDTDTGGDIIIEKELDPEPIDINGYMGSSDLNPSKRPLKDFDRAGMSKEDIDNMIKHSDGEIYLSDEQIKIYEDKKVADEKAAKEKDGDKKGDDDNAGKDGDGKEKGKKKDDADDKDGGKKGDEKDEEVDTFFEKTGLTQEEFEGLNEKAQENLVDKVFGEDSGDSKLTELETEKAQLQSDMETLLKDEFIALRVQEQTTGKSFIAKAEDIVTDELVLKFDALASEEKLGDAKKLLIDATKKLLTSERGVIKQTADLKASQVDTWKVLSELGGIDKRLAIKEKDFEKLKPGHPEWDTYKGKDGLGEVVQFLKDKGHTFKTIGNYSADEIYTLFSKKKGWDKDRDNKIHEEGKKSVLERLRNPKAAKSLKQGKKSVVPGSNKASMGIDYDTLKAELVKGDNKRYQQLLEASEGKPEMTTMLSGIFYEAQKEKDRLAKEKTS